ncbi:MAG TPA: Ig-like domain-containing protein [Longimicrobium sp.]|nr:Ig-like domain-containing protein [Longimicrobium sp.]
MSIVTRLVRGTLPFAAVLSFAACDSPTEERDPPAIELAVATQTVMVGSTLQVSATVTETDGSASTRRIQWRSADVNVATVNGSGVVTGIAGGTTTISASVGGTTQSVEITVMRAPNPGGPQSTFLSFTSTPGDWIGQGQTASYTLASGSWIATIAPNRQEALVRLDGGGATWWEARFAAPRGQTLEVGTYQNATRWPFQAPTSPGLSFSGSGRGCNTLTGRFTIHDIAVDHEGNLHRFHATFRQHCEGGATYLDGEVAILLRPLR